MSNDISGFGLRVRVTASNTFPVGFDVSEFADDTDALDVPDLTITGSAMGLNGQKVFWTSANPIPLVLSVIAGTDDERNLSLLFEANRAGRNKASARDTITMVLTYPDNTFVTLTGGSCDSFMPAKSVATEGRYKSMVYNFSFENRVGV